LDYILLASLTAALYSAKAISLISSKVEGYLNREDIEQEFKKDVQNLAT
jgi:hypothetical protein